MLDNTGKAGMQRKDQVFNKRETALAYLLGEANWWAAHVIHSFGDFRFAAPTR